MKERGRRTAAVAAVLVIALGCAGLAASVAVAAPPTTVVLTVDINPAQTGDFVTLTATVTGNSSPTGSVTFVADGTPIGTGTLTPVSSTDSVATFISTFGGGTHILSATFRNTDFSISVSPDITLTVGTTPVPADTTVTLSLFPATVVAGQPERLTAVVSQTGGTGIPTGIVAFTDNGIPLAPGGSQAALIGGVATFDATGFPAGSHTIAASYLGDTTNRASSTTLTFSITAPSPAVATTTTVTSNPSRITADMSVLLIANVVQTGTATSPPQGSIVTFYADGGLLGQAPLDTNGSAQLTHDGWLTGPHVITASYLGDINYLPSVGQYTLNVSPAPTGPPPTLTITAPSPSITYGGAVPALAPTYAGFVEGDTVAALVSPAVCTTTATSSSPAGTYPVICSGVVDPNYTIAYTAGSITVTPAPLTVTAANATMVSGQAVPAFTTTITGFVNGQTQTTAPVTGTASCTTTATTTSAAGTYPIVCTLGTLAAANYSFTFAAGTLTVTAASPAVVCTGGKRSDNGHDWDWWHDGNHRSHCESLLADPNPDSGSTVSAGQKLTIVYSDENQIGTGANAPTAVLSNGQMLPITVTQTSHQPLHYVDDNGGTPSGRYQWLLTFRLPSNLAPGQYSILVTAYDSTGNLDQWIWQVKVGKSSGHDDDSYDNNNNGCDWQSVFSRLLVGRSWINR